MATISRKRSRSDMQDVPEPEEFSGAAYVREVLRLEDGQTEDAVDEELAKEVAKLGIQLPQPEKGHVSVCDSAVTVESTHVRTASTGSSASTSTELTSRSSYEALGSRRRSAGRLLSFSEYDKYLAQTESHLPLNLPSHQPAPSILSVSSRRSYSQFKDDIKDRFRFRRPKRASENIKYVPALYSPLNVMLTHSSSCVCCRDDFRVNKGLYTLPCSHRYCNKCLRILIQQAISDEQKMPPKCCNAAIPSPVIKTVLSHDEQQLFLKSVIQFSTPWEARIFCPLPNCGTFIPPRAKIDPRHPFTVICPKCRTKVCSTCKREAHEIGQDCPADWDLEAVLKLGESAGWRRCYKCRMLVELTQGCSHITCRCKAQFCYICGAVWDPDIGCPNYCSGEEELERRRAEEEERAKRQAEEDAARQAEHARSEAELAAAQKRSEESEGISSLRASQIDERDRLLAFERKTKWQLWSRHGQTKLNILDKYGDLTSKMAERHAKTSAHLEDRQVGAEMELRASLKQSARSVQIRLKHMEAYCNGLGRNSAGQGDRVVTERDLRELGQQYNLRDDLHRMHEAKINVMREKQAKQMDQLLARQAEEAEKLLLKQHEELDALEENFGVQEERFHNLYSARKERLKLRWSIQQEICRHSLVKTSGLEFARLEDIDFPASPTPTEVSELVTE